MAKIALGLEGRAEDLTMSKTPDSSDKIRGEVIRGGGAQAVLTEMNLLKPTKTHYVRKYCC